jgi:hypothetical protein
MYRFADPDSFENSFFVDPDPDKNFCGGRIWIWLKKKYKKYIPYQTSLDIVSFLGIFWLELRTRCWPA